MGFTSSPRRKFINLPAWVTAWAMVQVLIFIVLYFLHPVYQEEIIQQFIFVPLRDMGFLYGVPLSLSWPLSWDSLAQALPYQLITYGFLHHDVNHLVFNVVIGLVFSKMIYAQLGGARWFVIFIIGLLGGAAFHIMTIGAGGEVGLMGASGGVAAWLGAALCLVLYNKPLPSPFEERRYALFFIIFFIVVNFLGALLENNFGNRLISNAGHLGGLLFGFLGTWLLMLKKIR